MLLEERLLAFDPDLVIVVINGSDVEEVTLRGGMERFRSDGSTVFNTSAPWWEWLYGINFTFRHIPHDLLRYDEMFLRPHQRAVAERHATAQINEAVEAFAVLSRANAFALLIVTHPHEWDVRQNRYHEGFHYVADYLKSHAAIPSVDLLEYYAANGIMTQENAAEFYWPIDSHHNGRGYQAMGDAIAETVEKLHLIDN